MYWGDLKVLEFKLPCCPEKIKPLSFLVLGGLQVLASLSEKSWNPYRFSYWGASRNWNPLCVVDPKIQKTLSFLVLTAPRHWNWNCSAVPYNIKTPIVFHIGGPQGTGIQIALLLKNENPCRFSYWGASRYWNSNCPVVPKISKPLSFSVLGSLKVLLGSLKVLEFKLPCC